MPSTVPAALADTIHSVTTRRSSTCAPGCGACCDPVTLRFHVADMDGPSAPFARAHWHEIPDYHDLGVGLVCAVRCDMFDPDTRTCTAYDDRPPICSGFPWYGETPSREHPLHPVCSYNADVRPMLPLTVING